MQQTSVLMSIPQCTISEFPHTLSRCCHIRFWLSVLGNSSEKLHRENVANMLYWWYTHTQTSLKIIEGRIYLNTSVKWKFEFLSTSCTTRDWLCVWFSLSLVGISQVTQSVHRTSVRLDRAYDLRVNMYIKVWHIWAGCCLLLSVGYQIQKGYREINSNHFHQQWWK